VFGECVDLELELGAPFKLDVLLVSHLNQQGFYSYQTPRDGFHDGGHNRRDSSTTARVCSRHSGTLPHRGAQSVECAVEHNSVFVDCEGGRTASRVVPTRRSSRLCRTRQTDDGEEASLVSMMKLATLTCCCLAIAGAATLSAQRATTTQTPAPANDGRALDPTISARASTMPATTVPPRVSPEQHLTDAKGVLTGVSEKSMSSDAQKNFSQLLKDFSALISRYADAQPQTAAWQLTLSDVERDLVRLVGGGGPRLTPPGGREAIPGLPAEVPDSATRHSLEAFRTHVELFYDAATTREPGGDTLAPLVRASSF
jgi:hypothetical protein